MLLQKLQLDIAIATLPHAVFLLFCAVLQQGISDRKVCTRYIDYTDLAEAKEKGEELVPNN